MKDLELLETIQLIIQIEEETGTCIFFWGGLVPDIYLDRILRPHDDLDCLVIDLYKNKQKLIEAFQDLNWVCKTLENSDLKVTKGQVGIHFGHVSVKSLKSPISLISAISLMSLKGNLAYWYHNGKSGKISFPASWLNRDPVKFQNLKIHAVKPEFQYVLKLHPEFMNPQWKLRVKDKGDIRQLGKLLVNQKSADLKRIENRMHSINN